MKYPTRIYYTAVDKAEVWDPWQKGESCSIIAFNLRTHLRG